MNARRTLVIHPGALGDVLQAIPALRALGGGEAVTFCGQPRLGALLSELGEVRESVSFDRFGFEALFTDEPPGTRLVAQLASFDEVVSWFGSRDAQYPARLRELARVRAIAPPVPEATSTATVWRHLLDTIAAGDHELRAPVRIGNTWRDAARRALCALGVSGDFVLVHPGAGGKSKRVPPSTLARVVAGPSLHIVVHQGPADREAADALVKMLKRSVSLLVEPELPLLAAVASLARVYVGGDSGVSHLAATAGAPSVILFPAATRERWAPWSRTARVIEMEDEHEIERAAAMVDDACRA